MCVHTLERKCRSCEMITIVLVRRFSTSSNQRMLWMSRLLVGSSSREDVRIAEEGLRE